MWDTSRNKLKKEFCYKKLFWHFTVCINCCSDLNNFANFWPSTSNFKSFSQSLEHFFPHRRTEEFWIQNTISNFFSFFSDKWEYILEKVSYWNLKVVSQYEAFCTANPFKKVLKVSYAIWPQSNRLLPLMLI